MIKKSIAIGVAVAFLLSLLRGGITDSFTSFVIFGLTGFFVSLLLFWLFGETRFCNLENSLAVVPQSTILRSVLCVSLLLVILVWSGSFIRSGGFAGWLLFLLVSFLAPLAVCVLAPRFSILVGICTATSITLSLLIDEYRSEIEGGNTQFWVDFWNKELLQYLVYWLVASVLSLPTSVPIYIKRRELVEVPASSNDESSCLLGMEPLAHSVLRVFAIIVIPLLLIFTASSVDHKLKSLREEYLKKSNQHNAAVSELVEAEYGKPITTLSELTKLEKKYALKNPKISWHREMSNKYWRAYNYPWLPVTPDK